MVESTRLESEHTGNRIVGSNPTLSAIPLGQWIARCAALATSSPRLWKINRCAGLKGRHRGAEFPVKRLENAVEEAL